MSNEAKGYYKEITLLAEDYNAMVEREELYRKALELACKELDDAKDMLRECGKNEWASLLNASADYFKARAKEMKSE